MVGDFVWSEAVSGEKVFDDRGGKLRTPRVADVEMGTGEESVVGDGLEDCLIANGGEGETINKSQKNGGGDRNESDFKRFHRR